MSRALRLLLVEDSEADAHLLLRELSRGYDVNVERVQTSASLRESLERGPWDLVISDCSMPSFNASAALAIVRGSGADVPFIVLSGTLDEEDAVEVLRAGANDFLTKGKLSRLLPAIERELREKAVREEGRHSQQRVKVTEERFRTLLESAPDGMVIVGSNGQIAFVNAQIESMFGYSREALVGEPIEVLVPVSHRAALRARRASFFDSAEPISAGAGLDLVALRRDGTEFPVEIRLSPARTAEGEVVTAAIRDVTARRRAEQELRRTEEQLRHAQKMEAVGALAGGIAHDYNNVLSVILSYTELLTDALPPGDPMRADVGEIHKAAERAVRLTRQLLAFSRKQPLSPQAVNVNDVIRGLEKMLRRLAGDAVQMAFVPGHALGMVWADPGQLEQVLMNLAVNARDAMPNGGQLTIETTSAHLVAGHVPQCPTMAAGPYVVIGVDDTGIGMDAATRERIFEPFFTTKESGKGTGLGLSVVYGIVTQSGGHVAVDSEPGRGTLFRVFLPQTQEVANESLLPAPSESMGGTETILLVEDDDPLRTVAAVVLRRSGYQVIEAQSAGEALLALEQSSTEIDLLLTDVFMPRMNGYELAERVSRTRPRTKVLFISGHAGSAPSDRDAGSMWFLEKPVTPDALLAKVRAVLDRDGPPSRRTA